MQAVRIATKLKQPPTFFESPTDGPQTVTPETEGVPETFTDPINLDDYEIVEATDYFDTEEMCPETCADGTIPAWPDCYCTEVVTENFEECAFECADGTLPAWPDCYCQDPEMPPEIEETAFDQIMRDMENRHQEEENAMRARHEEAVAEMDAKFQEIQGS